MTLPPLVDRHRGAVVGPEDTPVAVGLAANHYHFDLVPLEHMNQLVRLRFQHARVRFFAERCPWIDIILNQLVVPVLASRHARVVVNPVDELRLLAESTAIDKEPRGDWIE